MSRITLLLTALISLNQSLAYKLENNSQIVEESSRDFSVANSLLYLQSDQVFGALDLANVTHFRSKRRINLSKVKMPSGGERRISIPKPTSNRCGRTNYAKLVDLRRSSKEYEIVANEMENTKISLPNCAQRGGCVKSYSIFKIRKVLNGCLWSKYKDRSDDLKLDNNGTANEQMLFYGTHDTLDVVDNGFDERYVSVLDRPFGAGLYFAATSSAANELAYGKSGTGCPKHNRPDCTECKRRMILARVSLGREHAVAVASKLAHAPVGSDSVVGKLTTSPYADYIVYRGEQSETPSVRMVKMVDLTTLGDMGEKEKVIITREMQNSIKDHINCENSGGCYSRYEIVSIVKLINTDVWQRFLKKKATIVNAGGDASEYMMFHGTPEALNIFANGFDVGRAKPGGLFGQAIYFTPLSSKSNQYVWGYMGGEGCPTHKNKNCYICTRSMLLCRVMLGKKYPVTSTNVEGVTSNGRVQPPSGYHSIEGTPSSGGLRYPEYAIHHSDQAYAEYMIVYKIVK